MKRVLLPLSFLFVTLMSSAAFADHLYLGLNNGDGDNFGFIGHMNGHPLYLSGGTPYSFFNYDTTYLPGMRVGGGDTLYLYPTTIWVDGVATDFGFPQTDSFISIGSSFILPMNGSVVKVPVQITFTALGVNFDYSQTLQVSGHSTGFIPYYFDRSTGLYSPAGGFVQTPEPGTLGLFGIGIIGILSSARKTLQSLRI